MNSITDLNDHLFKQLDRLSTEDMTPEQIEQECKRSGALVAVADQITGNAELQLKAAKLYAEHGQMVLDHLPKIGSDDK